MENNAPKQIDFVKITKALWKERKKFFIILPVTAVLSYLLILCVPRYYSAEVSLAPEMYESSGVMGSISSIASSLGMMDGSQMGGDAIYPELYPDVIKSNDFIVQLFPIPINYEKENIKTNYYNYLKSYQKSPWWSKLTGAIKNLFAKKKQPSKFTGKEKVNTFQLTKDQYDVVGAISGKIKCVVDKKTSVISIKVTDQDPYIAAVIADSVKSKLQVFITNYRTNKARQDLENSQNLLSKAKSDYDRARALYGTYADANQGVVLESYRAKVTDLENDMQLKYNIYTTLTAQVQYAYQKVMERTPVFTTISAASVPIKPAGPKRMIFVAAMLFLAFAITSLWILRKEV